MSSHREAPEISKDPVADNTDVYAFVSPDRPRSVTLIANFIPFQKPDSGPNFFEFGDDVIYSIHVSNKGTARADITYEFRFRTEIRNNKTFLYATGPIDSLDSPSWNRPQFYSLTKVVGTKRTVLRTGLQSPPCNVGPRSTPNYADLAEEAVAYKYGRYIFAGQRADAFHVDLGSIFDLGTLRPLQNAHLLPSAAAAGVNGLKTFNVHTIALQLPIAEVTRNGDVPTDIASPASVIGVWASARRRKSRMFTDTGQTVGTGPYVQVSRLGNPLFNEVITPMAEKDEWNIHSPRFDSAYAKYVNSPELAGLLPVLYPGAFPNLAAYDKPRADLNAILLTGLPPGVVPGFQNYTGPVEADMLRLNVAVPPATSSTFNALGVVGGDIAGFPNGRRLGDDVTTIELRAIAGATIPLVDPTYEPDAVVGSVTDGTTNDNGDFLDTFPYMPLPNGGYQTEPGTSSSDGAIGAGSGSGS